VVAKNGEIKALGGGLVLEQDDEIVAITPPDKETLLWRALTGGA
jgi:hypothetical protein